LIKDGTTILYQYENVFIILQLKKEKNRELFPLYSPEAVKALNKKYGLYGSLGDQVSDQPTVQYSILKRQ
jgi:hypothetical protein